MSALPPIADIIGWALECLLCAISGHFRAAQALPQTVINQAKDFVTLWGKILMTYPLVGSLFFLCLFQGTIERHQQILRTTHFCGECLCCLTSAPMGLIEAFA
jgi:hypothetical protein